MLNGQWTGAVAVIARAKLPTVHPGQQILADHGHLLAHRGGGFGIGRADYIT